MTLKQGYLVATWMEHVCAGIYTFTLMFVEGLQNM